MVYSSVLGDVAHWLRREGIPVFDDLFACSEEPDIIHGHHHIETMTALLRYPRVPAVNVCHGVVPWQEMPVRHPRVLRHIAVSELVRERVARMKGTARDRILVIPNFVDIERFKRRCPLPSGPRRALVFNNRLEEGQRLQLVRDACGSAGIEVDMIGIGVGAAERRPERLLGKYDLVFASGRCALEALAVGTAVILIDSDGLGPIVRPDNFERLRSLNFAKGALDLEFSMKELVGQLALYCAADAGGVANRVRSVASVDIAASKLVSVYREVLQEFRLLNLDPADEVRAHCAYLSELAGLLNKADALETERQRLLCCVEDMHNRLGPVAGMVRRRHFQASQLLTRIARVVNGEGLLGKVSRRMPVRVFRFLRKLYRSLRAY